MNNLLKLVTISLLLTATINARSGVFPDFGYLPPIDWTGPVYELSQDYPQTPPSMTEFPWQAIDFKTNHEDYLNSVLAYCFEGNLEAGFKPQNNQVRRWFHAPWLHYGNNGREFVNGLTVERRSRPFELSPLQTAIYRNFAVGFYNDIGGYTIGQVWLDPNKPNPQAAQFKEGSVSFKLLFTTAPSAVVPYLSGAPEWTADVDRSNSTEQIKSSKVRLLQIDIAVRDNRAAAGWIFGTFHYDSTIGNDDPWKNLRPLALVWGNDPTLTETQNQSGISPVASWVNAASPIVTYRANPPVGATPPRTMGWAGRGNGPVDNALSSCLSCHMTAQIPANSPMTPPQNSSEQERLRWFRDLPANTAFDEDSTSLDFSLQLGVGIQNHEQFRSMIDSYAGFRANEFENLKRFMKLNDVPRSEWKGKIPQQYRFGRDPEE